MIICIDLIDLNEIDSYVCCLLKTDLRNSEYDILLARCCELSDILRKNLLLSCECFVL